MNINPLDLRLLLRRAPNALCRQPIDPKRARQLCDLLICILSIPSGQRAGKAINRQSIFGGTGDGAGRSYPHQDPNATHGQGDRGQNVSSSGQPPVEFPSNALPAQYQPPGRPDTLQSVSRENTYVPKPSSGFTHRVVYKDSESYDGTQSYDDETTRRCNDKSGNASSWTVGL
jgi:hypothetical protein